MRVSFLNLDRSPERLRAFLQMNSHLADLHRIAAFDGRNYSRRDLQAAGVIVGDLPTYTDGAIGCALSHLCLWESATTTGEVVTIAEDDAVFHHDFEELASGILESLPVDWDIVQWGWNFDSILAFELLPGVSNSIAIFDQAALHDGLDRFQKLQIRPAAYRLQRSFGAVCQSISPAGAAKLLGHCRPLRPMQTFYPLLNRTLPNSGIDNMMNDFYSSLDAYVCIPPLVVTTNDRTASTIQPHHS